jgi:hypothetical protein
MHSALLLLLLPLAQVLAQPSPQKYAPVIVPNDCTAGCAAAVSCPAGYPASCRCWNAAISRCATKCKQRPAPTPKDCSPRGPTPAQKQCMVKCQAQYACIQVWPQSCYCQNGITTKCAAGCDVENPALQECPPLTPEPSAA